MDKKIKDYLHLYLGCEAIINRDGWDKPVQEILTLDTLSYRFRTKCEIKPILRPLSDMTEEERKEYYSIGDAHAADESLLKFNAGICAEQTVYLLRKHFDLFGLIESGLAIDKTKL